MIGQAFVPRPDLGHKPAAQDTDQYFKVKRQRRENRSVLKLVALHRQLSDEV